jgi:indole-3-glycerol phosphate synthase
VSRLSQAIAEGDGISILVEVSDAGAAGSAEADGADVLAVRRGGDAVRAATQLPVLHLGGAAAASEAASDAVVVPPDVDAWDRARALGLECVVRVQHAEDLERALEELDPEIFLLSAEAGSDEDPLEVLLALLHDVPAGKLAIADLSDATADDVAELERAGVDGVLVAAGNVTALVGAEPPDV